METLRQRHTPMDGQKLNEYELYDIKLALDAEISELQTYRGLINDDILNIEIDAEIRGIKKAQEYLYRAILRSSGA